MDSNSLAHTKWNCKYHIVFTPKYRRQAIYKQISADIGQIIRTLCARKGVNIIFDVKVEEKPQKSKEKQPDFLRNGLFSGTPEGTRTPDLLVRSQSLYPTELPAHTTLSSALI